MKRIRSVLLSIAVVVFMVFLSAPQTYAEGLTAEQAVNYQNLVSGVTVMDDGIIYAVSGSSIRGFNAGGANVFTASLPAKCGNLCSGGDYIFAAGYMSGHMNDIYVLNPGEGTSCKTLDAGQRAQAVAVDYDGYLYCVNSTGTRSNGKKATKILRAKISDVVALSAGATINWEDEFQPDYTPPASDGNCYPQGIAVDGKGNIYIADKGSSNGHDGAVDGIYKYSPETGSKEAMYFTAGSSHRLFTWVYDICADDYGTVAVVGRNNYEIAVFEPGSTSADAIIKASGYPEGVGMDKAGNIYFNASNNSDTAKNGIYRINMSHVAVTGVTLSENSRTVYEGESFALSAAIAPSDATNSDVIYSSSDTSVATVDDSGKVTGVKEGKATITVKTVQGRKTDSCEVTVNKVVQPEQDPDQPSDSQQNPQQPASGTNTDSGSGADQGTGTVPGTGTDPKAGTDSGAGAGSDSAASSNTGADETAAAGTSYTISGNTLKVLSASAKTAAFTKAKNKKSVTVPATVKIGGQVYKVTQINANAFKGSKIRTITIGKNVKVIKKNAFKSSKATKLIVKTKLLKKSKVKGSLKGSKIKTVQVKVGKKSVNKKYVKKYKKIFTKKNAGRKVAVK